MQGAGFRVQGAGFRVQGAGCRVQGSGFRVQGVGAGAHVEDVGHNIPDVAVRESDSGFRVQGSGFRVQGSGFRVQGCRIEEAFVCLVGCQTSGFTLHHRHDFVDRPRAMGFSIPFSSWPSTFRAQVPHSQERGPITHLLNRSMNQPINQE